MSGGAGADVFMFDIDGDTGRDRIVDFGTGDVLVTTELLFDANGDGVVDFGRDRVLNLPNQGTVAITGDNGGRVQRLEYDGFVDEGGIRYFVYSKVGSAAGVPTLTESRFFDLLG
ncbi:hypothetical protein CKY28_17555 [Sphingomonas lenta]|uniref:Uncharacterized protein n=1 Tax=Sphingomonas lenta TaxID=1141887 RepID=A0A2A2SB11_9SPHN|nr:hypothetical protein CKY28_17555 [Sphingomonas lenta]